MRPVHVTGLGFFAPGFRDLAALRSGSADPAVGTPPAALLPPNLRRRASLLSRLVAEAVGAARGDADLAQLPLVTGSVHGEIEAAVEMIAGFRDGDGMPSPTRFHNSVHNTAAAHVAIATGNCGFTTAVAAGAETTAAALLEAWLLLDERGGEVLLALFDEPPPPPFAPEVPYPAAAVALLLSAEPTPGALGRLSDLRRDGSPADAAPAPFATHPIAPALALALALERGGAARVGLGGGFCVTLEGRFR